MPLGLAAVRMVCTESTITNAGRRSMDKMLSTENEI
jgi:hypothetical protein